MISLALTEHMPRASESDRYPDEVKENQSVSVLRPRHEAFLAEARRLRDEYAGRIQVLVGFEGEWIRPEYEALVEELAAHESVDFFIGSVHHVYEIPIDYDREFYGRALGVAGGREEKLFEDYFDSQYEMLKALRPRVVGHFDLIRLLSKKPGRDLREWKGVWARVVRNLKEIVDQGGLIEINSSALRKGLDEPYPARPICEEYLKLRGKLTLSDDSHGVAQIATNYGRAVDYVGSLGVKELWLLERKNAENVLGIRAIPVESVRRSLS